MIDERFKLEFQRQLHEELTGNILPFWIEHTLDQSNGGFYGALTNALHVLNDVPRSAVLCGRILWSYSRAYRQLGESEYLAMARRAYHYLTQVFWDAEFGGVYWSVDRDGCPLDPRKHSYAQAFAIYALAEYALAVGEPQILPWAQTMFERLERHAYDPQQGGYIEGCGRQWQALADARLSEKEPACRKSMNTLLHIMEAYTNLLRARPHPQIESRLQELIEIFLKRVIDPQNGHFRLFFNDDWSVIPGLISYGHEIEGSWLLVEAAEALNQPELLDKARRAALGLAESVYNLGRDQDGSIFYEGSPNGIADSDKHWWVQAEGMVGFYNAYQLSAEKKYALAAEQCWQFIEAHLVDRVYGEWYKVTDRQGTPYPERYKTGPWECPYHQSRAILEMMRRLAT